MDYDKDFEEFWQAYQPDEIRYPHRKPATYNLWRTRIRPAQQAMLDYVMTRGAPKWKNPYFFVQDFPEPVPTDWNGRHAPEPTEIACYKGHWGMYTLTDIERYKLQVKRSAMHG